MCLYIHKHACAKHACVAHPCVTVFMLCCAVLTVTSIGLSNNSAIWLAQLGMNVTGMFVVIMFHLMGLDYYNRSGLSVRERLPYLRKIYWGSYVTGVVRNFVPLVIGPVANQYCRRRARLRLEWD